MIVGTTAPKQNCNHILRQINDGNVCEHSIRGDGEGWHRAGLLIRFSCVLSKMRMISWRSRTLRTMDSHVLDLLSPG